MSRTPTALEEYRRQLNQWVAGLAVGDHEAVGNDADERYTPFDIDLFTEGNLDKRADILSLQLSSLAPAFPDLPERIDEYIAAQPLQAFDAGPPDAAAFLRWVRSAYPLTGEQLDTLACRQARYDVEDAARANRARHIRFQERLSMASSMAPQLHANHHWLIYLNPACGWARLHTHAFLDEDTQLPGNVVFFAVGVEIHSAALDDPIPEVLRLLEQGPLSLAQWVDRIGVPADELIPVIERLAEVGLLAFS